jgi:hypothetical protein
LKVHLQPDDSDTGKFTKEEVEVKKTGSPIPMAIPFYTGMQRQSFVHQSISEKQLPEAVGAVGKAIFLRRLVGCGEVGFPRLYIQSLPRSSWVQVVHGMVAVLP